MHTSRPRLRSCTAGAFFFALAATLIPALTLATPSAPGGHLPLTHGGDNRRSYPPLTPTGVLVESGPVFNLRISVVPNPSGGNVGLRLVLPRGQVAQVAIFDVAGRLVQRLTARPGSTPIALVAWDGRDRSGRRVSSGVYWARVVAAKQVRTSRFVILR